MHMFFILTPRLTTVLAIMQQVTIEMSKLLEHQVEFKHLVNLVVARAGDYCPLWQPLCFPYFIQKGKSSEE